MMEEAMTDDFAYFERGCAEQGARKWGVLVPVLLLSPSFSESGGHSWFTDKEAEATSTNPFWLYGHLQPLYN